MGCIDRAITVKKNAILWVALIAIFFGLMVLISRYFYLISQNYLAGPDTYYYALQVKWYVITGALKIHDSSPLLQLMGWTAKLGLSCEQTIILWTNLIQLLCIISVLIAARLIRQENSGSIILPLTCAWVILSPNLAFTCIEFPKYAFSLIFLPLWPVGLVHRKLWPVSLGAVILACVSHLTMIGLLCLVLFGVILSGITRLNLGLFKKPRFAAGIAVLVLVIGVILGGLFLSANWQRIQWRGLQPSLWTFFSRPGLPTLLKIEVGISVTISIILLIGAFKDQTKVISRFWAPFTLFLLLFPLGSTEIMGIPERLCLMLPLVTVCALIGMGKQFPVLVKAISYALVGLALVLTAIFPKLYLDLVHPDLLNPDYHLYAQVTQAIGRREIPMLIAHQGLNYFYKYQTMQESFPYEPESHWPKQKIWRIVYGITPAEWSYYLSEQYLWGSGFLFSITGPYSLIREDCWNLFRNQVILSSNEELKELVFHSWLNPSQKRPEFARRRSEKNDEGEFSAYPNSP